MKRKRETEDKLEREEQMQDALREDSHFNVIKMHLSTHFVASIKKFRNIPRSSTDIGESSHKDMIKVHSRLLQAAVHLINPLLRQVIEAPII